MSNTFTTLDSVELDHVTGGFDAAAQQRIATTVRNHADVGSAIGWRTGMAVGALAGLPTGPLTTVAGAGIGATIGYGAGLVGGAITGGATGLYRELTR